MQPDVHQQLVEAVRNYKLPDEAERFLMEHPPLIVSGITASGKTAVVQEIQQLGEGQQVITHTTRKPRAGEVNGQNYYFVNEEQMLQLISTGAMIEANAIHGQTVYGISIAAYKAVAQSGQKPLLIIEVQGIQHLLKSGVDVKPYFLLPPNFETWMERLDKRGAMSYPEKHHRLLSARDEMQVALRDNHFTLVINQDLRRTVQEILRGSFDPGSQHRAHEIAEMLMDHTDAF